MVNLINRPEYLNQLIQNKDVNLIKIVTGIRRYCGNISPTNQGSIRHWKVYIRP